MRKEVLDIARRISVKLTNPYIEYMNGKPFCEIPEFAILHILLIAEQIKEEKMETEKTKTIINREQVMDGLEYLTISKMLDGARKLLYPLLDEPGNGDEETAGEIMAILDGVKMIMEKTKEWTIEALDGRVSMISDSVIAEMQL